MTVTERKLPGDARSADEVNAVDMYGKMRKSLGSKRKELRQKDIERICHLYDSYASLTQGLKRPPTQRWALGVMTPTPPNLWGMATKFGHRLA